jgi:hypothetical protein
VIEMNVDQLPAASVKQLSQTLGLNLPARIEGHMVDNAAYGRFENESYFVVFPKSQEYSNRLFGRQTLWNSSYVMAHEFGHHVFYHHVPQWVPKLRSGDDEAAGCFHATPRLSAEALLKTPKKLTKSRNLAESSAKLLQVNPMTASTERSSPPFRMDENEDADRMISAINEAFADLFGYYANGAQNGYTQNMGCFEQNREVSSKTFKNSLPKQIDHIHIQMAFVESQVNTPFRAPSGDLCALDWRDSHILGAVLANYLDRILSLKTASSVTVPRADLKASFLLNWLEQYFETLPERKKAFDAKPGPYASQSNQRRYDTVAFILLHLMQSSFDVMAISGDQKHNQALIEGLKESFPFVKNYCALQNDKCSLFPISNLLIVNR